MSDTPSICMSDTPSICNAMKRYQRARSGIQLAYTEASLLGDFAINFHEI